MPRNRRLAALYERQHAVLANQFLIDSPDNVQIDLDGFQVQKRYTEFVRCSDGDGARVRLVS